MLEVVREKYRKEKSLAQHGDDADTHYTFRKEKCDHKRIRLSIPNPPITCTVWMSKCKRTHQLFLVTKSWSPMVSWKYQTQQPHLPKLEAPLRDNIYEKQHFPIFDEGQDHPVCVCVCARAHVHVCVCKKEREGLSREGGRNVKHQQHSSASPCTACSTFTLSLLHFHGCVWSSPTVRTKEKGRVCFPWV